MSDAATVNHWLNIIRRAELELRVKTIAYYLAGRANRDGTHLYPGIWRTSIECNVSAAEVRRALKLLRDTGLIEMTRRGNRRQRQADEYRLIIRADVLEHVKIPTPDEHDAAINALRDRDYGQAALRRARMDAHRKSDHSLCRPDRCEHSTLSTLTQKSVKPSDNNAHPGRALKPVINAQEPEIINAHPEERAPLHKHPARSTTPPYSLVDLQFQPQGSRPPSVDSLELDQR